MVAKKYTYGLGRRKSATATARLYKGKGEITINGKPALEYLSGDKSKLAEITDPLALAQKQKDFDISILVKGGGLAGQVDAIKLAISKAITLDAPDLRPVLKKVNIHSKSTIVNKCKKFFARKSAKNMVCVPLVAKSNSLSVKKHNKQKNKSGHVPDLFLELGSFRWGFSSKKSPT